nr:DUF4366 domain-containing protein [Anaerotignum sp.]
MKRLKLLIATLLILGVMISSSTVAFAGGGPETDTMEVPIVITENPIDTEKTADTTQSPVVSTEIPITGDTSVIEIAITEGEKQQENALTPDGNLTLVDDITTNEESNKQFITAVTKNGNYFYLVIDRSDDKDNVYLLNMVDEADLMALMEGEPVPMLKPEEQESTPTESAEKEPVKEETQKPKNNTLPLLLLVLAMGGGGAFYYLKFVKNKNTNKGNTDLNEFAEEEFDDDEDYELDEDEEYLTDDEDTKIYSEE